MALILVIDDEKSIRNSLKEILEFEGYEVHTAENGLEGLNLIKDDDYDLVICDIKMPKMDGKELLSKVQSLETPPKFIMISGHGNVDTAIESVKMGAFDYIPKPPDMNKLLITVKNALENRVLKEETKILKKRIELSKEITGESSTIKKIKATIEKVAPTDARVLITGENGTGKELVARWIHEKSHRAKGPFIEVNCAAIPNELIESELFGHEKGSFTSAINQRKGKFELAHGGTLFLDEIGDMDLAAQSKVLRALQEAKITRIGGDKDINVDVRVIAATNKKLDHEITMGNFRMDLYHRLSVILIHVPTLNERKEDIPTLANQFCEEICSNQGIPVKQITPYALKMLQDYEWTGNIRELRNVIERLVILGGAKISDEDVQNYAYKGIQLSSNMNTEVFDQYPKFQDFKEHIEKQFIEYKLNQFNWNVSKTADEIDIQRSHLYNKIEKFNLKRGDNS
ncbi:MAG: sigma-54-dependent Fis family transcriptional regulator [Chitinophagales bacterium]|nr:sigma-54-dependent Fis family transcriptional regulator [Chitinophagales bacterium]